MSHENHHAVDEHEAETDDEPSVETSREPGTGLESNVAAAVSYLLGPVTGILLYVLEPEDEFVRFHAAQSTIVFGGLFVLSVGLSVAATVLALVPVVGWLVGLALGAVGLLLVPVAVLAWLGLMYKAYTGEEYTVPLVGGYARRYASTA